MFRSFFSFCFVYYSLVFFYYGAFSFLVLPSSLRYEYVLSAIWWQFFLNFCFFFTWFFCFFFLLPFIAMGGFHFYIYIYIFFFCVLCSLETTCINFHPRIFFPFSVHEFFGAHVLRRWRKKKKRRTLKMTGNQLTKKKYVF